MVSQLIFRQYDIRGLEKEDLDDASVESIGKAFGTYLLRKGKKEAVVGKDVRLSGPRVFKALVKGIMSTGCNVVDIGTVPTPVFYFVIWYYKKDGGVIATASHNPPEYNGFKMCNGIDALYGDEIMSLYTLIKNNDFIHGEGVMTSLSVLEEYKKHVIEDIKIPKKLKVVIDSGNGAAGLAAPDVLRSMGVELIELFSEPDGNFPNHTADPTVEKNVKDLMRTVVEKGADIGIGFDGDVDRIGVVDEKGRLLFGDTLLGIYAKEVLEDNPGAEVVFEVKSSQGLVERIQQLGGKPMMWKAGHSLLKAKMKEDNALLGGEVSGHMFFRDRHPGYDDAIYGALRILEILAHTDKKISELAAEIPAYVSTPELRVDCPDDVKFDVMDKLIHYFKSSYKVIDVDGVRVLFDTGWSLIRPSNTQPVLVVRMEAKTKEDLRAIVKTTYDKLCEYPEIDPANLKPYTE